MTDFAKTKMAFVVALLAVLFTLSPLMGDVGKMGPPLLGLSYLFTLQIRFAYYLCSGFLGFAAYFYALELFKQSVQFAQRAGNLMYAFAILVPPAYLALIFISLAGLWLRPFIPAVAPRLAIQGVLIAIVGVLAWLAFRGLGRGLREKDRLSSVSELRNEEASLVSKAGGLLEAGLFDLVLVECVRAVETALRKLLLASNVSFGRVGIKELLEAAESHNVIEREVSDHIHDIRVLRNQVLHEGKSVTRTSAQRALQTTRRIVTSLDKALAETEANNGEERATSSGD